MPETFFTVLPFAQVMVLFFAVAGLTATEVAATGAVAGVVVGALGCAGLFTGATAASWESFKRIVGEEKVKFRARSVSQPSFS